MTGVGVKCTCSVLVFWVCVCASRVSNYTDSYGGMFQVPLMPAWSMMVLSRVPLLNIYLGVAFKSDRFKKRSSPLLQEDSKKQTLGTSRILFGSNFALKPSVVSKPACFAVPKSGTDVRSSLIPQRIQSLKYLLNTQQSRRC